MLVLLFLKNCCESHPGNSEMISYTEILPKMIIGVFCSNCKAIFPFCCKVIYEKFHYFCLLVCLFVCLFVFDSSLTDALKHCRCRLLLGACLMKTARSWVPCQVSGEISWCTCRVVTPGMIRNSRILNSNGGQFLPIWPQTSHTFGIFVPSGIHKVIITSCSVCAAFIHRWITYPSVRLVTFSSACGAMSFGVTSCHCPTLALFSFVLVESVLH